MPKFMVEIIASYPCTIEAENIDKAIEIAEGTEWENWPDEDCEIIEYRANLIENDDNKNKVDNKQKVKLFLIKGDA
jgi:hypothetical protein